MVVKLIVNRVDLVKEGANSAAFIELYKRKESNMTIEEILNDMKDEHAKVIKSKIQACEADVTKANGNVTALTADLKKAKEDLEDATTKLDEAALKLKAEEEKKAAGNFDEAETMKSLPKEVREYVDILKSQKELAEEAVRKANEQSVHSEAVAKAATLKSLPVKQEALVSILKGATPELVEVLSTIGKAIDATVLGEVGKSNAGSGATGNVDSNAAWAKIEAEADKIMKSGKDGLTKQKAITQVIKSKPELYKAYIDGGAE